MLVMNVGDRGLVVPCMQRPEITLYRKVEANGGKRFDDGRVAVSGRSCNALMQVHCGIQVHCGVADETISTLNSMDRVK